MDDIYNTLVQLISLRTNSNGTYFTMGKFTGLGWLKHSFKNSNYDDIYPMVSLKQYDKTVNLYVMLWGDNDSVIEQYSSVFGKSAIGKSCIRIKKLDDKKIAAIEEIIDIAIKKYS